VTTATKTRVLNFPIGLTVYVMYAGGSFMVNQKNQLRKRRMSKNWRESMKERNKDWMESREKPKEIVTKIPNKEYRDGWDRIFGGGGKNNGISNSKKSSQ